MGLIAAALGTVLESSRLCNSTNNRWPSLLRHEQGAKTAAENKTDKVALPTGLPG